MYLTQAIASDVLQEVFRITNVLMSCHKSDEKDLSSLSKMIKRSHCLKSTQLGFLEYLLYRAELFEISQSWLSLLKLVRIFQVV